MRGVRRRRRRRGFTWKVWEEGTKWKNGWGEVGCG
jgi:hypothetical protein